MQGLILAAGMATRLKPLTDSIPKCLLSVGGKPILNHIISSLMHVGITEFVIVVGFCAEQIIDYVTAHFPSCQFAFVSNHEYKTTNNAYSLLLAKNEIKDDFVLLDSDVMFDEQILSLLLSTKQKPVLAVVKNVYDEEAMKVQVDSYGHVCKISKEITMEITYGESVGIEVFDYKTAKNLFEVLEKRVIKQGFHNEYYEATFQEMIEMGFDFLICDIGELYAIEIDNVGDLKKAQTSFKDKYLFRKTRMFLKKYLPKKSNLS